MVSKIAYCDRCYKQMGIPEQKKIRHGVNLAEFNDANQQQVDLCYECFKELNEWYFKPQTHFLKHVVEYWEGGQLHKYEVESEEVQDADSD